MQAQITISVFVDERRRPAQTSKSPPPPISPIHQIARTRSRTQLPAEVANQPGKASECCNAARKSRGARTCAALKPAPMPKFGLSRDDLKLHFPGLRNDPTMLLIPAQLSFDELLDWDNSQAPNPLMVRLPKSPKSLEVIVRRGAND
jgi:hypothetical protein